MEWSLYFIIDDDMTFKLKVQLRMKIQISKFDQAGLFVMISGELLAKNNL